MSPVNGNGHIRIVGKVGRHDLDLQLEGLTAYDLYAMAGEIGLLDEYRKLETTKERDVFARRVRALADSMLKVRRTR